jgi:4-amino-4-deoxy-L-arabinose transferase-like glycosyltransferase
LKHNGLQRTQRLMLGSVLLVALALRTIGLVKHELWFDEAYAGLVAAEPSRAILADIARDSSPPLYYLLLHAWTQFLGLGPAALRSFSVVCGLAAVYLTFRLGRAWWDMETGVRGAALLAVSPLHIYYSQDVRPYALLMACVLGSLLGLEQLSKRPHSVRVILAYVLATIAAVYVHTYGLLLLVILMVAVVRRVLPRSIGTTCGVVVVATFVPWVPAFASQVQAGAGRWLAPLWEAIPPAAAVLKSLGVFCIGGISPAYVDLGVLPAELPIHLLAFLVFAVLVFLAEQAWTNHSGVDRATSSLAVLLGTPFALSFVKPVYLVGRYEVIALPLFLLICACGWQQLARRRRHILGLGLAALAVVSLAAYYGRPPIRGVDTQAAVLIQNARPQDIVLCTGFTRPSLEYYARLGGGRVPFRSYPLSLEVHRGWVDQNDLVDPDKLNRDAASLVDDIARSLGVTGRLWVAHSRLLTGANAMLMLHVESAFHQERCPANAEALGFTCWTNQVNR